MLMIYLKGKRRLNGLNCRSHLEPCERALTSELAGSRLTPLQVALRPAHWSPENAFQAKIIRAFHRVCKMLTAKHNEKITLRMDFTAIADFNGAKRNIFDFITASLQSRWFWREACDGSLFTKAGNSPKTRGKYFLAVRKCFP